ncbi:Hypothetical predicted protein, partial [Paramuricea clavata]
MKVKLATQVLSHSVEAALMMAISGGLLPASASGTAELVSHFDDIFDCLNSSTFSTPKECNRPMTASSKHMQTMKDKLEFVKKIKVINAARNKDVTSSLKCLNALQITLRSTMELWKTVQAVKNSKTAKIDSNIASKEEKENSSAQPMLFHDIQDVDYKSSTIEENLTSNNATTYVCGYLLKRCLEKHSCQTCSSALIKNELDSTDKLLCYFKAYETSKQPFGGLTVPDDGLVQYISKAEQIFIEAFPTIISKPGIAKQLVSMIPQFQ